MTATHTLQLPLTEQAVRSLALGDMVHLNGEIVITAGLPTHQRILEHIERGQPLPIDLRGATLFHLGSYSREDTGKFEVLYMNPTTSTRFNPYMPKFIRTFGLRAVGGKGGLDAECARAMKETGCVYLSFLGGGATLHSQAIKEVVAVAWDDLIAHYRLVTLRVEDLGPLTVAIDAHGNSLYDELRSAAQARLPEIMEMLARDRSAGQAPR
ncbi:MAG TPA: fumarate hydratase C-terminal domain-containing protein [Burkholderiales bacterium]|nr:fumarate hydratase C-terminal domain-containing protein [Burkholderiales bacterium]